MSQPRFAVAALLVGTTITVGVCCWLFIPRRLPALANGPSLQLEKTELEVSTALTGIDITIGLTNAGDAPLEIRNVESTCGCLKAEIESAQLLPGQSSRLLARIATPAAGTRMARLTLHSNDAAEPVRSVVVRITKERKVPYILDPPESLVVRQWLGEELPTETVRFTTCEASSDKPWLQQISCTLPEVSASLRVAKNIPMEDRRLVMREYAVELAIGRHGKIGEATGLVSVMNSNGASTESVHSWQLSHVVVAPITAIPSVLRLDVPNNGELPAPKRFALVSRKGRDSWKVLEATTDRPWLKVEAEPCKPDGVPYYKAVVLNPPPESLAEGKVTLKTSDATCPSVVIRVVLSRPTLTAR